MTEKLSFYEHLDDLRIVLFKSFFAIVVGSCIAYFFIDQIIEFLIKPVGQLVFTAPADAFIAQIILILFSGFVLSLPFVVYQIWTFFSLGLKAKEKKFAVIFAPVSFLLFVLGGSFSYFIVIPIAIEFLLGFSNSAVLPMITIKSYISFVITMILSFGVIFELPLILMFLTKIGIATPAFLIQKRKFAVVIMLIVSALITPPDVVTQLMLAVPLMILYEIGVGVSVLVYKNKID